MTREATLLTQRWECGGTARKSKAIPAMFGWRRWAIHTSWPGMFCDKSKLQHWEVFLPLSSNANTSAPSRWDCQMPRYNPALRTAFSALKCILACSDSSSSIWLRGLRLAKCFWPAISQRFRIIIFLHYCYNVLSGEVQTSTERDDKWNCFFVVVRGVNKAVWWKSQVLGGTIRWNFLNFEKPLKALTLDVVNIFDLHCRIILLCRFDFLNILHRIW